MPIWMGMQVEGGYERREDDKKGDEEVCITKQKWGSIWRGQQRGEGGWGKAMVEN